MEKFWIIGREGAEPVKRYKSKNEAIREADVMAKKLGDKYYIFEALGYVALPNTPIYYHELDGKVDISQLELPDNSKYAGK